jgi:hypothetical protein
LLCAVDVIVQIVEHFVLQSRLSSEVLSLKSGGLHHSDNVVQLAVGLLQVFSLLLEQLLVRFAFGRFELTIFGSFSVDARLYIARLRVLQLAKVVLEPLEPGPKVGNFLNAFLFL